MDPGQEEGGERPAGGHRLPHHRPGEQGLEDTVASPATGPQYTVTVTVQAPSILANTEIVIDEEINSFGKKVVPRTELCKVVHCAKLLQYCALKCWSRYIEQYKL